jgi:DNA-binding GntR family transcriptional regulator
MRTVRGRRVKRARIESGQLTGQVPTTANLAEELGVSDTTIVSATSMVKDEVLIFGVAGLGMFVRKAGRPLAREGGLPARGPTASDNQRLRAVHPH